MTELAPECCIVCGIARPEVCDDSEWTYIAGARPVGSLACSNKCLTIAIQRHKRTGRVDCPKEQTNHEQ